MVSTTRLGKPIVALMDSDKTRGGLTVEEVRAQLLEAEGRFKSWGFKAGTTPGGAAAAVATARCRLAAWTSGKR